MQQVRGQFNSAKVFTDNADDSTIQQVKVLCDQKFTLNSRIRLMPDCHAGKGCTIGTTMTIVDKVVPFMVGTDICCGVLVAELSEHSVDLSKLDKCIRRCVPYGHNVQHRLHRWASNVDLTELKCWKYVKGKSRRDPKLAIGSLGQNNHFIELNKDNEGDLYLVIHTGSRNLGLQVANYYQQAAFDALHGSSEEHLAKKSAERQALVDELTAEGRAAEISKALEEYNYMPDIEQDKLDVPFELSYCEGQLFDDYIHDMAIAQEFATLNREAISDIIQCGMRWDINDLWETRHNYIDLDKMILRKGAISAQKDEIAIIPMNMRDGSLIVKGKGNPDWNYSAPHGAGRLMSRTEAKNTIPMKDFKASMEGIYTTCVSSATIDEAPQAYKPMREILDNIEPTCEVLKVLRPIYNFKAS